MVLRAVVEASVGKGLIKPILKERCKFTEPKPPLTPDSYIRVSQLSYMCAREEVLKSTLKVPHEEKITADLALIFAHGRALHSVLQNDLLPRAGLLLGQWNCTKCGRAEGEQESPTAFDPSKAVFRPERCACGGTAFLYEEYSLLNEEFRLTGHPDGLLQVPGLRGLGILEAKSIASHRVWEVKDVPRLDHVVQAQAYLWLTGLRWAKILYWEKGGFGTNALVEHHVERDDEQIASIKQMIRSMWHGVKTGRLPARICAKDTCERAEQCSVRRACFDRHESPVLCGYPDEACSCGTHG